MVWSWLYYGFLYFINVYLWICDNIFFVISTYMFFLKEIFPNLSNRSLHLFPVFYATEWISVYCLHSWQILCIFPFDRTTGNLFFSTFIEGRTPKQIETKIIRGEEHSGLSSFELEVLAASHFILLPGLMYIKCSYNRNGRLIKRECLWITETETFQ